MTGFWADKLNGPAAVPPPALPAARPPAPAAPPPAGPWWGPTYQQPQPQAPVYAPAGPEVYVPTVLPLHMRQVARQTLANCPECGGDNYFEVDPKQGPRCYSCNSTAGNRTRNSTQGMAATSQGGSVRAARQVVGPGYRPDIIVGHI